MIKLEKLHRRPSTSICQHRLASEQSEPRCIATGPKLVNPCSTIICRAIHYVLPALMRMHDAIVQGHRLHRSPRDRTHGPAIRRNLFQQAEDLRELPSSGDTRKNAMAMDWRCLPDRFDIGGARNENRYVARAGPSAALPQRKTPTIHGSSRTIAGRRLIRLM